MQKFYENFVAIASIIEFMFSKKATKIEKFFTVDLTLTYLVNVKSTMNIWSIFVAFLENMNFTFVHDLAVPHDQGRY
jgi:hypothetical protein